MAILVKTSKTLYPSFVITLSNDNMISNILKN